MHNKFPLVDLHKAARSVTFVCIFFLMMVTPPAHFLDDDCEGKSTFKPAVIMSRCCKLLLFSTLNLLYHILQHVLNMCTA